MKKFLSVIFALLVLAPCTYFLTACGETEDKEKVMNVDLNPKLEFVLDKNDKVVSVNALNDDGNHILSLEVDAETAIDAFEGMTAEQAMDLFLELTEDNGYLITGKDEKITISISGDEEDLLNSVKNTANKFFTDNGINMSIVTDAIEKSELVAEVEKCMQEYTNEQLNEMSEEDLIGLLKSSRRETKEFLTQELKEAYYALRAQEINVSKLQALYDKVLALSGGTGFDAFKSGMTALTDAVADLEEALVDQLLNAESEYNKAMEAYVAAKEELLNKRLELAQDGEITETEYTEQLKSLEGAVQEKLDAIYGEEEGQYKTVFDNIKQLKDAVQDALDVVEPLIESVKNMLATFNVNLDNYHNAVKDTKDNFATEFKGRAKFSGFVGKDNSYWGEVEVVIPTPAPQA